MTFENVVFDLQYIKRGYFLLCVYLKKGLPILSLSFLIILSVISYSCIRPKNRNIMIIIIIIIINGKEAKPYAISPGSFEVNSNPKPKYS